MESPIPEGPSTQYPRFLTPKPLKVWVFGARNFEYWQSEPSGDACRCFYTKSSLVGVSVFPSLSLSIYIHIHICLYIHKFQYVYICIHLSILYIYISNMYVYVCICIYIYGPSGSRQECFKLSASEAAGASPGQSDAWPQSERRLGPLGSWDLTNGPKQTN